MRILIYALVLIFAVNAIAHAEAGNSTWQREPKLSQSSGVRTKWMLSLAREARLEQNFEKENQFQALSNLSVGVQFSDRLISFERSAFSETSGNSTLDVRRNFQDYMIWADYSPRMNSVTNLFLGMGVGAYQDTVETRIYSDSSQKSSDWRLLGGANFGIQLHYSVLWTSLEIRALVGDEFDHQPKLGGLAKIGLQF